VPSCLVRRSLASSLALVFLTPMALAASGPTAFEAAPEAASTPSLGLAPDTDTQEPGRQLTTTPASESPKLMVSSSPDAPQGGPGSGGEGSGSDGGAGVAYEAAAVGAAVGAVGLAGLVAPLAKYGVGRLVGVPLYARFGKTEVLNHAMRERLLEAIRREPGMSPGELSRLVDCSWNTLVYHLGVLEREGYVSKAREGRRWRFFPTGSQDHSALPLLAMMRNPTAARILGEVRAQPGIAQHALSARTALRASTIHWHMERLQQGGFVRAERAGRTVHYFPGPALSQVAAPIPVAATVGTPGTVPALPAPAAASPGLAAA